MAKIVEVSQANISKTGRIIIKNLYTVEFKKL